MERLGKTKAEYVIGKRPEFGAGPGAATQAAVEGWDSGDQRARVTLGFLLYNLLNLIKGSNTARETWEKLEGHYEKVSLFKQICDKRYYEGEDIEQHVFRNGGAFRAANGGGPRIGQKSAGGHGSPETYRNHSTL